MKGIRILTAATVLVSGVSLVLQLAYAASPQLSADYETGMAAYKRRDFKKAAQSLEKAFAQGNSTPLILLYIGHSYLGAGDKENAMKAYCKISYVYPRSPEAKVAAQSIALIDPTNSFRTTSGAQSSAKPVPLPPTRPGSKARRWLNDSMPLRVYVTNGLELPGGLAGRELRMDQWLSVTGSLKNDSGYLRKMSTNSNYGAADGSAVQDGVGMWGTQSSVKFTNTSNAADADVIVFFADTIDGGHTGFCQYPTGLNQPNIITIAMSGKPKYKREDWYKSKKAVAAHEFGHALGLDHLPGKDDIMYPTESHNEYDWGDYLFQQLSSSDRGALSKLYSEPPGFWMGRPSQKQSSR